MNASETTAAPARTWSGLWSGLIWFVVGYLIYIASEIVALVVVSVTGKSSYEIGDLSKGLIDGDVIGVMFLVVLPLVLAMLAFVVKVRRKRSFGEYLSFQPVAMPDARRWLLVFVVLYGLGLFFERVFDRPLMPEWMIDSYATTDYRLLFWLSVGVLAPLAEELLFRGYLLRTWAESKAGPVAAVLLSSLLWSGIHLQYDLYDMTQIFVLGCALGISRLATGSLYPAMAAHVSWNTIALFAVHYL